MELLSNGWSCRRIAEEKGIPLGSVFNLSRRVRLEKLGGVSV
jgi:hypothetical protein